MAGDLKVPAHEHEKQVGLRALVMISKERYAERDRPLPSFIERDNIWQFPEVPACLK